MRKIYLLALLLLFSSFPFVHLTAQWKATHVVLIGLDGWGAYSVEKSRTPHIHQLMQQGAYTLQKRSVLPSSSAVNWASMFMGAGPELHGYTSWNSRTPDLPPRETTHYGMFPSVWGLLRDQYPETEIGYFCQWDGLMYLAEMEAINTKEHVDPKSDPDGRADRAVAIRAVEYIRQARPNMVGIFFDEPDHTGHKAGHDTEAYYQKMEELDGYIGQIIAAVKEAGMYEKAVFIVTSDHGGIGKGHGGITMEEMQTPFVICGKGIKQGHSISASMMQYDVAPTIAHLFGLTVPQVWVGRSMREVFEED